ncbi:hypothetical protein [Microvirga roseola]|uniref:hypothetical protein n=1 Tax=Microvirga roseola TaxID=2883126 RepID=UPI001E5EE4C1|nr:hypothetical protein [Microvirga roseola]
MKFVAAGLTASVAFLVSHLLLVSIEDSVLNLMGWADLDPPSDLRWWRASLGLATAACAFYLTIEWRNNAALKVRKTLAARARA